MARLWGVAVWALLLGSNLFVPPGWVVDHSNRENRKRDYLPLLTLGDFEEMANKLTAKDEVDSKRLEEAMQIIQSVVGDAQLILTGSRRKGTAIAGSDYDYHLRTKEPMTIQQLIEIVRRSIGKIMAGGAALKVVFANPPIDLFPPNAEWNSDREVEEPGDIKLDKNAKVAIIWLKKVSGFYGFGFGFGLERVVLRIQSESPDLSAEDLFIEACERIFEGMVGLLRRNPAVKRLLQIQRESPDRSAAKMFIADTKKIRRMTKAMEEWPRRGAIV